MTEYFRHALQILGCLFVYTFAYEVYRTAFDARPRIWWLVLVALLVGSVATVGLLHG